MTARSRGRDETIWLVYAFDTGCGDTRVAVFDGWGNQMPQYQSPGARTLARLEAAYPRRLWHEWIEPGLCRCGAGIDNHPPPGDPPFKKKHKEHPR